MELKTSVAVSNGLLEQIDLVDSDRSTFLERAATAYLARQRRAEDDAHDAEILEREADYLNGEAAEFLEFQELPE
jgi:hypothetical protein